MNRRSSAVRKEIISWGKRKTKTQKEISLSTGVSQSQVSKILRGEFKTISQNVRKVCEYSNIQINLREDQKLSPKLEKALLGLWDGTRHSEKAIVKALAAMKEM